VQKSKKAAAASAEPVDTQAAAPVVVPAVMVSPDVIVIPAASMKAAASSQADANGGAQTEPSASGSAVKGPTGARAFKRVNDEEWLGKKGAWDNSYEAKFGSSGWGAKASQTLLQVAATSIVPAVVEQLPTCKTLLYLVHKYAHRSV